MSTAPAEAKKCSYEHEGWHCRFDAEEGHGLCIFHQPVDTKKPDDFWRHLASYLSALLERSEITETREWALNHPDHWVIREADEMTVANYAAQCPMPIPTWIWTFTGFKFPAMVEPHNFANFVFPRAGFRSAEFSGHADFGSAEFVFAAEFADAKFGADAIFTCVKFHGKASFTRTAFIGPGYFISAKFEDVADFTDAEFDGEADFLVTVFASDADFGRVRFDGKVNLLETEFDGKVDFSFVHFVRPPQFSGVDFRARVDFYEARLPGLSEPDGERTARNIRFAAEKHRSCADAGSFYAIEMDHRRRRFRKTPRHWFQYVLMELYRLASRYGESPGRALASLAVALLLFSYAFVVSGFWFMGRRVDRDLWATPSDLWLAARLALVNLLPGNLPCYIPGAPVLSSPATRTWAVAQVIVTYVLLTMFLLAIRRRFRR